MKLRVLLLVLLSGPLFSKGQVKVYVHLDTSISKTFTGRLYLFTQADTTKQVVDQPDFQNPPVFFAKQVNNWNAASAQVFDDAAEKLDRSLSALKPGYYKLAAVIDANEEERAFNFSPGNAYSRKDGLLHVDSNGKGEAHVYINGLVKERPFKETEQVKLLQLKSRMLSAFHHKDVFVKAGVILPPDYDKDPARRYPVVFIIPGWGGTHYDAGSDFVKNRYGVGKGKAKIYVYLNPETQTHWGLHAFVDSRVNGPWGKALVEEVIPYLKNNYRASNNNNHFFVMGQSSGGYPSLWLQLHYPRAFNGCWAVSPDPVDFSNFTGVDLYREMNLYTDEAGKQRPFFLMQGKPLTDLQTFVRYESFYGDGGQIQSFEAEFGKPGKDGRPKEMFDRKTGVINREVVNEWKPYDLGWYILQNWKKLAPEVGNKAHVYAGSMDNFFLNKAVEQLGAKAARMKASITAELIPGADHWSIWSPAFTERIQREIDERIQE